MAVVTFCTSSSLALASKRCLKQIVPCFPEQAVTAPTQTLSHNQIISLPRASFSVCTSARNFSKVSDREERLPLSSASEALAVSAARIPLSSSLMYVEYCSFCAAKSSARLRASASLSSQILFCFSNSAFLVRSSSNCASARPISSCLRCCSSLRSCSLARSLSSPESRDKTQRQGD